MTQIQGTTRIAGVMGWPVSHSLSPAMHNAAMRDLGLDAAYIPFPVHPERVGEAVRGLRGLGMAGSNVTVPHKVAVIDYLDRLTPQASVIGAVNTIRVEEDGSLTGHNTDCEGAARAVIADGGEFEGKTVAVLGAGGAGRGAAAGAAFAGASKVVILNRTVSRAESLVREFEGRVELAGCQFEAAPLAEWNCWDCAEVILQMTSLGMHGEGEIPWRPDQVPPHCHVLEAVYKPLETEFLSLAQKRGLRCTDGLAMLLEQGIAAFEFWFGKTPHRDVMRAALDQALK